MSKIDNKSHFVLTKTNSYARIGEFVSGNKKQPTPTSVIQNSIGGGSGDILRLISYTDHLPNPMPVLLTYYNLAGYAGSWSNSVKEINQYGNINNFILHLREEFFKKGYFISNYKYKKLNWDPISILDSGSGNFLRDELQQKSNFKKIITNFNAIIPKYFEFCAKHEFNIMISLDFAGKYTHKDAEKNDPDFDSMVNKITNDSAPNLQLLSQSLLQMGKENYDFLVYAPIHGNGPKEMTEFTKQLFKLEKTKKFDGIAIGGIARWSKDDYTLWNISKSSKEIQHGIKLGKAVKIVRKLLDKNNDKRPIHVLGAGGIKNIIPLVSVGADTFDNVTPWRRSTDGSLNDNTNVFNKTATGSFSKYLIPLLDKNCKVIKNNKKMVLNYVELQKPILDGVFCDCGVCSKFSLKQIRKLYSVSGENFYYARILCYVHAMNQFQLICTRLRNDIALGKPSMKLIQEITDPILKNNLQIIIKSI